MPQKKPIRRPIRLLTTSGIGADAFLADDRVALFSELLCLLASVCAATVGVEAGFFGAFLRFWAGSNGKRFWAPASFDEGFPVD